MATYLGGESLVIRPGIKTMPQEAKPDALGRNRQARPVHKEFSLSDRVGQVRLGDVLLHPLTIAGETPPLWQKKLFAGPKSLFLINLGPEIIFSATSRFLARDGEWRRSMIKVLGATIAVLGMTQGKGRGGVDDPGKGTLYVFFSEKTASAPAAAQAASQFAQSHPGRVVLRPALLVEDWTLLGRVTEYSPLFQTVRRLGEGVQIQVYDEEALRLAAAWKIVRLPAVALVVGGRAHVVQGSSPDLESLWRCSR